MSAMTLSNLQKARTQLLLKRPFWGTMLMTTPLVADTSIPTAATDMEKIYYNPAFFDTLTVDLIQFVLAHEIMHIMFEHGLRRGSRNPMLWNVAGDYAINFILKADGFTIWDKCLYDAKYARMSAEVIYDKLQQEKKPNSGSGDGEGQGGMEGDLRPCPGNGDPAQQARVQRSIQQRVATAASVARMAGNMSGEIARLVDSILNPTIPWRDVLRDYMTRTVHDDESWNRRNRRMRHAYLPGRQSLRMGEITFIVDTSGSIGPNELNAVAAEIQAVADQMKPEAIRVIWWDADFAGEQVFTEGEPLDLKPKGGGGTRMDTAIQYVEQFDPDVCVLLTDGYTPWPSEPPYPLIVVCTTDIDVPVGQVVRLA